MKNLLLILLGVLYFGFYILKGDSFIVFNYITDNIKFGKELISYFNGAFAVFTSFGVFGIIIDVIKKYLVKLTKKTDFEHDDIIANFIIKFLRYSKYLISLYIGFYFAIIPEKIQLLLDKAVYVGILIIILVLLTNFINILFEKQLIFKSKMQKLSKNLVPFINKMVVFFVWVVGVITIIGNLGYDITALVAGAGIGGLAIALAAKPSLANIFGAISIMMNKPFKIGDVIQIGNTIGTVSDIGLTYLTLKHKMGHQVMIPNENIITTEIENLSIRENRRTDFAIGLVYGTSLDKMKAGVKIVEDILQKYADDGTIGSFRVNFDSFGDFSLNINATYFSLLIDDFNAYIKQKENINLEIKNEFEKAGLDMAFPTQELILKKED